MTWSVLDGDCLERLADLDDDSIDAVVTDPPYGISFMGKEWDGPAGMLGQMATGKEQRGAFAYGGTHSRGYADNDNRAFQVWTEAWATELLRVLKPGGHLLAFGGTRTYHRLASGIEDAGFEIRDCLAWHYGSGFPKSLDVSKAIDKRGGESVGWFGPWFRQWREENGITQREVARLFPSKTGNLTGCVANWELGLNLPTPEQFNAIVAEFGLPFSDIQEAEREVVGERTMIQGGGNALQLREGPRREVEANVTAPATDLARQWQGWGTALKPAFEPIILARKPLIGTVAENVTRYGTGALNVDGCRVGTKDNLNGGAYAKNSRSSGVSQSMAGSLPATGKLFNQPQGRWPANLILDEEAAAILDEQSGETVSRSGGMSGTHPAPMDWGKENNATPRGGHDDRGGSSRFFYQAKASRAERNAGLDGFEPGPRGDLNQQHQNIPTGSGNPRNNLLANVHPTVKPIDLMRWLVRLVTPPGGTVLDPFTGSGTTGIAAGLEGFDFVGIEREAEYREIAEARLRWWGKQEGETAEILQRAGLAEKERAKAEAAGQTSLFEEAA